jgi:hypothetical protein
LPAAAALNRRLEFLCKLWLTPLNTIIQKAFFTSERLMGEPQMLHAVALAPVFSILRGKSATSTRK